ncbi:hypothetical protein [Psychroserpens sp.]
MKLYLNGDLVWEYTSLSGAYINSASRWNSDFDFEIGRNT